MKKVIRAVIFDFDGVIVDSETLGMQACESVMKVFGVVLDQEDKDNFYGFQDLLYYQQLCQKHQLEQRSEDLLNKHNKEYCQELSKISKLLPGVLKLLHHFKEQSVLIGICSGSYRQQVLSVLENLSILSFFDEIITAEDTKEHKPSPVPYLYTAKKLGVEPSNCLVFEDSEVGVKAAKAAGMHCIGVNAGNHGTQNLRNADTVIEMLEDFQC